MSRSISATTARTGTKAITVASLLVLGTLHSWDSSWNTNSRMALVFAVVDRGTLAIDGYEGPHDILPTMDKAAINNHYYSDKVIGVSLLAVPVYAAMQAVAATFGFEWGLVWKLYALRMASASIPAVIALALLWRLMVRVGAVPGRALFAVWLAFLGSSWFGYSTTVMPYSAGIAAILAATYLELYGEGRTHRQAVAIGGLLGFAIICDFIFGLMVLAIAVVFLARLRDLPVRFAIARVTLAAAGAAVPLGLLAWYCLTVFGELTIPYRYEVVTEFREGMAQGFMGITTPRLGPAWFLTVHPYRGMFFWSPWTLLALVGCVMGTQHTGAYLLFNSAYYMWWGGWAMSARLMLPMMASLPMGLAEICRPERSVAWWRGLVAAGVVSVALSAPVSVISPQLDQGHTNQALRAATIATPLGVPQVGPLREFYTGSWFVSKRRRLVLIRALPLATITIGSLILVMAARRIARSDSTASR